MNRSIQVKKRWVCVANAHTAKIYNIDNHGSPKVSLKQNLDESAVRVGNVCFVTNITNHMKKDKLQYMRALSKQSYEIIKENFFVTLLAGILEQNISQRHMEDLIIVAPPQLLQKLEKRLCKIDFLNSKTIAMDLTNMPQCELMNTLIPLINAFAC